MPASILRRRRPCFFPNRPIEDDLDSVSIMDHWKSVLNKSLVHPRELAKRFGCDPEPLLRVARQYPMRINPYYLALIRGPGDPIWRQAVPDEQELADAVGLDDPLAEEALSPVPNLVQEDIGDVMTEIDYPSFAFLTA